MIDPGRFRMVMDVAVGLTAALVLWFGGRSLGVSEDVRFLGALAAGLGGVAFSRRRPDPPAQARPQAATPRSVETDQDAVHAMRSRLAQAMRESRKVTGQKSRYALPWYLVLGPEGTGKTTLLDDCGLRRMTPPAAGAPTRPGAVAVTESAVFIDTSGAFVAAADLPRGVAAGWQAVLGELASLRPVLPVNGIILALSVDDLYLADSVARQTLAEGMRARLLEVQARHDFALPVYVLLTKLDIVPGFVEFFARMDADERDQPWGFVLPLPAADESPSTALDGVVPAFDNLVAGLAGRRLALLQQEPVRARAARIEGFPAKVAVLRSPLVTLLATVFAPVDGTPSPLPRGVFLTSSRQDGLTVDPLMPEMSARFAVGRPLLTASTAGAEGMESQPWFIARPMRETILAEAGLGGRRRDPYGRRVLLRRLSTAACVVLCLGTAALMVPRYGTSLAEHRRILAEIDRRLLSADPQMGEQLRVLEFLVEIGHGLPPSLGPSGVLADLDHAGLLAAERAALEADLIDRAVMPRLVDDLRQRLANPDLTVGELAADLALVRMLNDDEQPVASMVSIWLEEAAERTFPVGTEVTSAQHRLVIERTQMHLLSPHRPHLVDDTLLEAMEARMGRSL